MISAAVVSAAKPCTGCNFTIRWPSVRMMRQPPAAVPAAMVTAHRVITHVGQYERWRLQKIEPARQMIEAARFCPGKKRQRDDAHRFLRVICAVAVRHPGRAEDLQFSKYRMNKLRREAMQRDKQQKHEERAENEPGNRRRDHRHDNLRPHTVVPFHDRPIAAARQRARRRKVRRSARDSSSKASRTTRWQCSS